MTGHPRGLERMVTTKTTKEFKKLGFKIQEIRNLLKGKSEPPGGETLSGVLYEDSYFCIYNKCTNAPFSNKRL